MYLASKNQFKQTVATFLFELLNPSSVSVSPSVCQIGSHCLLSVCHLFSLSILLSDTVFISSLLLVHLASQAIPRSYFVVPVFPSFSSKEVDPPPTHTHTHTHTHGRLTQSTYLNCSSCLVPFPPNPPICKSEGWLWNTALLQYLLLMLM